MNADTTPKVGPFGTGLLIALVPTLATLLLFRGPNLAPVLGAATFTVMVWSAPDRFRTRSGSLVPAIGLAAFLWLCAAVFCVLSLSGAAM